MRRASTVRWLRCDVMCVCVCGGGGPRAVCVLTTTAPAASRELLDVVPAGSLFVLNKVDLAPAAAVPGWVTQSGRVAGAHCVSCATQEGLAALQGSLADAVRALYVGACVRELRVPVRALTGGARLVTADVAVRPSRPVF